MLQSSTYSTSLKFSWCHLSECTEQVAQAWRELEKHSVCGNAFLSIDFLRALARSGHLKSDPYVFSLCNEQTGECLGLTVLEKCRGTKHLPLPHLITIQSVHNYRSGLLVKPGYEQPFVDQLVHSVSHNSTGLYGVEFNDVDLHSSWCTQLILSVQNAGGSFRLYPEYEAPVIDYAKRYPEQGLESTWSASRRKTIRKNYKKLEKHGPVSFRIVHDDSELPAALETFLQLERNSWKGNQGSALACTSQGRAFANELLSNYRDQCKLLITQLLVGQKVAATALNLRSGDDLFAIKISWDQQFEAASPGTLHEIELAKHLCTHTSILRIDGCTKAGSYLEQIWPQRKSCGSAVLSTTLLGRGMGKIARELQLLKRKAIS